MFDSKNDIRTYILGKNVKYGNNILHRIKKY